MRTLGWSDREIECADVPYIIACAITSCALDHAYDRPAEAVPWGLNNEERAACIPIVARHLFAIEPAWAEKTVHATPEQRAALVADLDAVLRQCSNHVTAQKAMEEEEARALTFINRNGVS